jgi:hypothetical protein
VDKNGDLKNRVRDEMNQLDLVVVQKTTKEIRVEDQTHAGRRRRTPQFHLCWVWGCPCQRQGTIAAPHGLGENGSRQAYESHFHQQQMAGIGAGVRWPWQGKRIMASTKMELAQRRRA